MDSSDAVRGIVCVGASTTTSPAGPANCWYGDQVAEPEFMVGSYMSSCAEPAMIDSSRPPANQRRSAFVNNEPPCRLSDKSAWALLFT
ncbi:MAG: hypothetical protein CMJ21_00400 [Phycisphaerae bacterium]|nr:hypothetical protein [Phycisphaerae bacterium]